MALITVGPGGMQSVTRSGLMTLPFLGLGTRNVTGTVSAPIDVALTSVAGIGLLDTINVQNANVTLNGVASVGVLNANAYNTATEAV
jgi:hypothetical protein